MKQTLRGLYVGYAAAIILLSSALLEAKTSVSVPASNVAIGSIQFPQDVAEVPSICVYWCGLHIPESFCMADEHAKRLTFKIQKDTTQRKFYLLVSESIKFVGLPGSKSTTVDHLEVPTGQAYKLYALSLEPTDGAEGDSAQHSWKVSEVALKPDRRIPDQTLIVRWNPDHVIGTEGGSATELPALVLAHDLVTRCGSQKALQNYAVELLLTSLDSNIFHAQMGQEVKVAGNRILALPVTT